ncbi:cytochrome P450 716B1-like [Olea europaea var. sylvestris]|uniref:cytochrome P450 716B1-like n=1 Tax=Olea europaea var. sylvestris TaxID=158386 RepID=UPI000C1D7B1D|nr:cytochrome P450 716B1-like [Olea europaea var. sylvestris]XP_022879968.1 cytochrome P450 716B1-like [Olea europaea var. sylvestris]
MNIFLCILLPVFFLLVRRKRSSDRVPPGSLGLPVIGQSLSFLWAMRANTADRWIAERAKRYGPISKLSLFGKPAVFIHGQAANKFVFTSDDSIMNNHQTESIKMILGDRCLSELSGEDHKRVRSALASFLKPECLKLYIGEMEEEVRRHLEMHWNGKQNITVLPLMKTLTFNIICTLLFGVERGARRDKLVQYFQEILEGLWSIPINFPLTRFNRGLKASAKVQNILKDLVREKRVELESAASSHQDLITSLLNIRGEDNRELVSEDEIVHNIMLVMVAGHDTSAVLISFIVRLLANDPAIYAAVLKEQEEIKKSKPSGEFLTWQDLAKMKHTWRVAMETLRTIPPVFGGFRKTLKDIEYEGYLIPKGWQVFWVTSMTHMDNNIFQEPSKFDPYRFENQAPIPPYCYIPFGGGPRMCPGYEFARIETLVTVHYLVTQFNWKLCCNDNSIRRDPVPVPAQGLPIQIRPK